jgi:hypothetical protein
MNLDDEANKRFARVCAEYQGIDLKACVGPNADLDFDADREVATRLKIGLRSAGAISRVGLDPEAFAIDRTRRTTPCPAFFLLVITMPMQRCSMAAAARSPIRSKSYARCALNATCGHS